MPKSNQFDYKGWSCNLARVGYGYYATANQIDGWNHFFTRTFHGPDAKRHAKAAVISEVNRRERRKIVKTLRIEVLDADCTDAEIDLRMQDLAEEFPNSFITCELTSQGYRIKITNEPQ